MRNEVKVGILAVIAVALSFWGYKFIQGKNILSASRTYYSYYADASGLTVGSPLKISGVNIGSVSAIELDQQTRLVKVTMEIKAGFQVPPKTIAYIGQDGLLGGSKIDIFYDQPCGADGTGCLPGGSEIEGRSRSVISSFLNTDPENPTEEVMEMVDTVLTDANGTFFGEDSDHPIARATNDLAATMANLNAASVQLQTLMAQNTRAINETLNGFASLSTSLASRQEALTGILDNTNQFTSNLA
ncbi:MAG: MlaD family protein, partial [Bacteroidota bacterium]